MKKRFCTAKIYATRNEATHWVIRMVVLEHNSPKPEDAKLVKALQMDTFNPNAKRKLMNDYNAGVAISKIRANMALERGWFENMPFTKNDMRHEVHDEMN